MRSHHLDGGTAFPEPMSSANPGMSLRDWFAGQALKALPQLTTNHPQAIEAFVADAYIIADAMLKERAK